MYFFLKDKGWTHLHLEDVTKCWLVFNHWRKTLKIEAGWKHLCETLSLTADMKIIFEFINSTVNRMFFWPCLWTFLWRETLNILIIMNIVMTYEQSILYNSCFIIIVLSCVDHKCFAIMFLYIIVVLSCLILSYYFWINLVMFFK